MIIFKHRRLGGLWIVREACRPGMDDVMECYYTKRQHKMTEKGKFSMKNLEAVSHI